jgi:hypothetical protein
MDSRLETFRFRYYYPAVSLLFCQGKMSHQIIAMTAELRGASKAQLKEENLLISIFDCIHLRIYGFIEESWDQCAMLSSAPPCISAGAKAISTN